MSVSTYKSQSAFQMLAVSVALIAVWLPTSCRAMPMPMPMPMPMVNCTRLPSASDMDKFTESFQNLDPTTLCPEDARDYQTLMQQLRNSQSQSQSQSQSKVAARQNDPVLWPRTERTTETSLNESIADESSGSSQSDNGLIPLYCGVMGLIIVSSMVYAAVKQHQQCVRKRQAKKAIAAGSYRPFTVHTGSSSTPTWAVTTNCSPSDAASGPTMTEPLLTLSTPTPPSWYKENKSCFVNDDTIDVLCTMIESQGVDERGIEWWRRLAVEMNFDEAYLQRAEYEASSRGASPLWVLLSQLAHANDSWLTQSVLAEALSRIGKSELCSSLQLPTTATVSSNPIGC